MNCWKRGDVSGLCDKNGHNQNLREYSCNMNLCWVQQQKLGLVMILMIKIMMVMMVNSNDDYEEDMYISFCTRSE